MKDWIITRLKEPSTYAGLAGLALAIGLSTEEWSAVSTFLAGAASLVAVLLGEKPAAQ